MLDGRIGESVKRRKEVGDPGGKRRPKEKSCPTMTWTTNCCMRGGVRVRQRTRQKFVKGQKRVGYPRRRKLKKVLSKRKDLGRCHRKEATEEGTEGFFRTVPQAVMMGGEHIDGQSVTTTPPSFRPGHPTPKHQAVKGHPAPSPESQKSHGGPEGLRKESSESQRAKET